MAKVYVSSTRRDLEPERRLVLEWLANHHHERHHSYVADSDTVRASCIQDVLECDAFILILGHRYGYVPTDENPQELSITELEYDAASAKAGIPVIVLQPTYLRNVTETDIGRPVYAKVLAFRTKVASRHRPAEFDSDAALIDALSLALERSFAHPQERPDVQAILRELARVAFESAQKDSQLEQLRREIANRHTALEQADIVEPAARPAANARQLLRAFLCHSSGDKEGVRKYRQLLKASGFAPWLDEEDLLPGSEWQTQIEKEVRRSHVVLVFLSGSSVNKAGFVQKEIRMALDVADQQPEGTIYIIPVRLEECDVPERLQKWHWVDLHKPGGYEKLVAALKWRETTL